MTELKGQHADTSSSSSASTAEGESKEAVETHEGVAADDFEAYQAMMQMRLDGLYASTVVLIVAVFFAAGIMAVQTVLRSLEKW